MRGISKAETKAMQAIQLPRHLDGRFKMVVIDGVAKVNTNVATCYHSINGGPCITRCSKMGRAVDHATGKVSFYWEDGQLFIKRAGVSTIHVAWGEHQPFADIEEEEQLAHMGVVKHHIPYETILKYDVDSGAIARSVWLRQQASGESEYPIGSARSMVWPEESGCLYVTTKKGKANFIPCPLHTAFAVLKKAREANPNPQHVALKMIGFCLWPLKPQDHELPKVGEPWSYDDLQTWRTKITARTIFNRKYRRMDSITAGKKAFGYLNHLYPDASQYQKGIENISIPDDIRYEIQRKCWLGLRRAGVDIEGTVITHNGPNAMRVYRELTHSLLADCPHTINPGEGFFGSTILRHLAVDQNLKERTSKKKDFSDDKSRVRIITGDLIPGSLFNTFPLHVRVWMVCGDRPCTKDCIQRKLFNIKRDVNGLRMLSIGMESLLRDHDSEMISDVAITFEGVQEKRKAISGLEEDMWRTGHDIIREAMENRSKASKQGHTSDRDEVLDGIEALNLDTTNGTGFSLDASLICEAVADDLMVQAAKDFFTIGVTKEIDDNGVVHHRKVYGPHKVKVSKVTLKTGYLYDFKVRDWVVKDNSVTAKFAKQDKAWWAARDKQNKLLLKKLPFTYDRPTVVKPKVALSESERDLVIAKFEEELAVIHARNEAEFEQVKMRRDSVDEEETLLVNYTGKQPHRYTLWSSFLMEQELKRRPKMRCVYTVSNFFKAF
jgi:hypothetical protein